jgi:diguanylate cyclase (GGDEF)-like protein/PAS domain S-box-containing protein
MGEKPMRIKSGENAVNQEPIEIGSSAKRTGHIPSEDEWHAIFDFLSDPIMVLGGDCKILMANKAAVEFLCRPLDSIIGNFCYKVIHGTAGPVAGCPMTAMLKNLAGPRMEEADLYLDNRELWARVTTYPPYGSKDSETRVVHVIRNIDGGKRTEEALRKRVRELNCLYELSRLIETKGNSLEDILAGIPSLIPGAFQYPKIAEVKLVWADREFSSRHWKETPWMLSQDILVGGKTAGSLHIAYLAEGPDHSQEPFLPEERNLLQAIVERLGRVIEHNISDAALRENEERYRIHFENISDVSFSMDHRLMIKNISPSVERVLGYKPEELMGKRIVDANVLTPESQLAAIAGAMRVLAGERPESSVYQFISRDGKALMGEVSSAPLLQNGKIVGMISVARDVTKRYRTEQEIKRINTLLSTQQENSPDGILVVDEQGKTISYNHRFAEIWNISPEWMEPSCSERALQIASEKSVDPEGFVSLFRHLTENGSERSHDEILLKDGRILERYSAPMIDEDKHYYGRVWYYRDITQRRQTEKNIIHANEQLVATVNKLEERNYYNSVLSEMREILQACSSVSEVPPIIRGSMSKLFPYVEGALYMMIASRLNLESAIRWGDFSEDADENMFAPNSCWALRLGRAHLVEDAMIGPLCPHVKHHAITAHACLPLVAKGEVLGMLHLRVKKSVNPEILQKTISGMKELAGTISEYLSLSIANIQLNERLAAQSVRDPLTGLFNRRYMEESLQREILRAERKKTPIGIVMIDIDNFKGFNDRYGHGAGDELLARMGDFFRARVRGGDVACRYGGEEFILFLPESSAQNTYKRADEMQKEVKTLEVRYRGEQLTSITLSFGIATYPDQGTQAETLLRAADVALYRAKKEGRNRIVMSQASTN